MHSSFHLVMRERCWYLDISHPNLIATEINIIQFDVEMLIVDLIVNNIEEGVLVSFRLTSYPVLIGSYTVDRYQWIFNGCL